jgi:hypothetical protein
MASQYVLKRKRKTVKETSKKQGIWIFADTECRVDKKVTFTWNSLFQAFQDKEFQTLLKDDISIELSKEIYKNIIKFGIHWAAVKTPILPCPNVIEWITRKVDHENIAILNFEDESVACYKASDLIKCFISKNLIPK